MKKCKTKWEEEKYDTSYIIFLYYISYIILCDMSFISCSRIDIRVYNSSYIYIFMIRSTSNEKRKREYTNRLYNKNKKLVDKIRYDVRFRFFFINLNLNFFKLSYCIISYEVYIKKYTRIYDFF